MTPPVPLHEELLAVADDLDASLSAFAGDPVTGAHAGAVIIEGVTLARAARLLTTAADVLSVAAELPPPGS